MVFWAKRSLTPGDDWDRAILPHLRRSVICVALISSRSPDAFYARDEIRSALQLSKVNPRCYRVVPVFLDHDAELKAKDILGLGLKHGIHAEGKTWDDVAEALRLARTSMRVGINMPTSFVRETGAHMTAVQLVDGLESLLLSREHAGLPESRQKEISDRIDAIVHQIMSQGRATIGSIVAGAKLVKPVGAGNFATIWLASSLHGEELVATKIFHFERLNEGVMLWRFRRSIKAMQHLNKLGLASIVPILDVDESTLAFSMPFLSGGNLEDIAKRGWTTRKKIDVVLEVSRAVAQAHRAGIVHRDIKPANVVLNSQEQPLLTDFDIADIRFVTRLSISDGGLGTPVFAAPEQLENADDATESSDIYSLGRFLYYLLLERSPGVQIEPDPSLENLSAHPAALVAIIRKATQFDPRRRYSKVEDLIDELETYEAGVAALRAWSRGAIRWLKRNAAVLTIFVLVTGGTMTFAMLQQRQVVIEREQRERIERLQKELNAALERLDSLERRRDRLDEEIRAHEGVIAGLKAKREVSKADLEAEKAALAAAKEKKKELDGEVVKLKQEVARVRVTGLFALTGTGERSEATDDDYGRWKSMVLEREPTVERVRAEMGWDGPVRAKTMRTWFDGLDEARLAPQDELLLCKVIVVWNESKVANPILHTSTTSAAAKRAADPGGPHLIVRFIQWRSKVGFIALPPGTGHAQMRCTAALERIPELYDGKVVWAGKAVFGERKRWEADPFSEDWSPDLEYFKEPEIQDLPPFDPTLRPT